MVFNQRVVLILKPNNSYLYLTFNHAKTFLPHNRLIWWWDPWCPSWKFTLLIASQIAPSIGSGLSQLTSIIPLASSMPIINILDKLMVWIVFVMIYL